MSVQAEYFKVDISVENQVDVYSINKDNNEIIKKYLENLKYECNDLIGTLPEKNEDNNFVEIISVDNSSIFGIVGKSKRVEESVMRKIRDQEGENVESTDFNLEDYRFFVFHTPSLRCAVIKNSTAPAFQQLFSNFLREYKTPEILNVNAIPIKDENINQKFTFFKKLDKVNMIFAKGSSLQKQILSLNEQFDISENSLVKSTVTLDLKDQNVSQHLQDLIKNRDLIEHEFEKLEFTGTDGLNQRETLEFVKKLLTLNINIDIHQNALKFSETFFDQIKKALLASFNEF